MTSTTVIDFWKANPKLWIPITLQEKAEADKIITESFLHHDITNETIYGKIIYLDQFYRHFHRYLQLNSQEYEDIIKQKRLIAIELVLKQLECLDVADEIELLFSLMPFKHLEKYDFVLQYINNRRLLDKQDNFMYMSKLYKFFADTYKKAYTLENIIIEKNTKYKVYNHEEICDFYPEHYQMLDLESIETYSFPEELINSIKSLVYDLQITNENPLLLSLSGGVDSMVMLATLVYLHIPVAAVHIVYGNRHVSIQEYNFIIHYCMKLNVPIFGYQIEYIRRNNVEREFYESMTRDIRFNVYKKLNINSSTPPNILLGHIHEDLVENIWTNIAKCQHLHNLKKMKVQELIQGVNILRPFLHIQKDLIYKVSQELGIPYLKNTTPSWSNRGKFRTHFYKATHDQFGTSVDRKLIEVSEKLEAQATLIQKLLYEPIFKSFSVAEKLFDITPAIQSDISENEWSYIFEIICHKLLGISKPSVHSIRNFCLQSKKNHDHKFVLTKDLCVKIYKDNNSFLLKIL